jgi:hypothetical protein
MEGAVITRPVPDFCTPRTSGSLGRENSARDNGAPLMVE